MSAQTESGFSAHASRQFVSWLKEQKVSLALTTYQAGKIFFVGVNPQGSLSITERTLDRCMGLCITDDGFLVSTLYQLWYFRNMLTEGKWQQCYDALYKPQASFVTGDLDIHDIALTNNGEIVFVNTLFSCLAYASEKYSFTPVWKPPFISRLAPEDRCHMNGMAMKDGQPSHVTAIATTDIYEGWREHREQGGVVINIETSDIICRGLSMPHSPRWHQETLWLLNSGKGEIGYLDTTKGTFEPVVFCPGYLRGLAFHDHYAIVGLSKPRNKTFAGLELDKKLEENQVSAKCGLWVVDTKAGHISHSLVIEGIVNEIYDVAVIPDVTCPMAIGFKGEEIRRMITIDE